MPKPSGNIWRPFTMQREATSAPKEPSLRILKASYQSALMDGGCMRIVTGSILFLTMAAHPASGSEAFIAQLTSLVRDAQDP